MNEFNEIKSYIDLKRDIKYFYNFELIFSFLDQRKKLDIIIYNKQIQKMLGINIENYKEISNKYKIGKKNGKGSEYILNTNNLIFEGEYINGKKNGKGKEYYANGNLEFEGEYINGKKNGKGKEYYYDGELKFEGEYINGIRNGKGKEYNLIDLLEFEGIYLNGQKWKGKFKEYIINCVFKKKTLKKQGSWN